MARHPHVGVASVSMDSFNFFTLQVFAEASHSVGTVSRTQLKTNRIKPPFCSMPNATSEVNFLSKSCEIFNFLLSVFLAEILYHKHIFTLDKRK